VIGTVAMGFARWLLALILAPLLLGVINRVKAVFAGRTGPPLVQPYRDIVRLLGKGAVYSTTTGWIFRTGPAVSLAAVVTALAMVPLGGPALLAFRGDFVLVAYLLALGRFVTVLAALDTGSAFEGMGASREVTFSALAEPALLLALGTLVRLTGGEVTSLSGLIASVTPRQWVAAGPSLALAATTLGVVLLAECSRIPFDDPNTHLELTMIHEVMVLDHGGPDFAMIQYAAALKLWVLGSLLTGILVPVRTGLWLVDLAAGLIGMAIVAVATGVVESTMARLRLIRVPQVLVAASVLSTLALVFVLR
jgi:formate hydrogenlyase subunit 4